MVDKVEIAATDADGGRDRFWKIAPAKGGRLNPKPQAVPAGMVEPSGADAAPRGSDGESVPAGFDKTMLVE